MHGNEIHIAASAYFQSSFTWQFRTTSAFGLADILITVPAKRPFPVSGAAVTVTKLQPQCELAHIAVWW